MEQVQLQLSIFLENVKWFAARVHKYFNQGLWLFYVSSAEIKEWTKRWDKHWCCLRGGAWNCLSLIHPTKGLSRYEFFAAIDIAGNRIPSITSRVLFSCESKGDQNSYILQKHHLKWFVYQWWGLRCYHPSPVVVLSSAFCLSENWQCGIKLACLSSLSRTCFWSMFSVSETRYISVFCAAAPSNSAGK